jgi:hypothetical protein
LGLFFAMEETNASDYLWDQFEALEAAPMPLGFQAEFKDHGRCRDSWTATLGSVSSQADGYTYQDYHE